MSSQIKALQEFERFRLDLQKKILWHENQIVNLPPKAVELLCVLVENKNEVLSKEELLGKIWQDSFVEESNLTHHIYELRKTFKELGCRENLIQTVPRRGYRFIGDAAEVFEREEIIIERSAFTQTLIEEISDEDAAALQKRGKADVFQNLDDIVSAEETLASKQTNGHQNSLAAHIKPLRKLSSITLLAGILAAVLAASGFAVWRWNQKSGKASLTDVKSIAVLPLKSFDKNADEALRLRMTDSLITRLGSLRSISIRPTSAVLPFTDSEKTALEIGKNLEVDAVLDGRIQHEGEKIRVTLQLVSVKNGEQIWSKQFDGQADQLLNLQDAISSKLLTEINLPVTPEQIAALDKRPTENAEAFENYLRGRYFWQKRSDESLQKAIFFYEKAIQADPDFAEAYVGLADSYYLLVDYSYDTSAENVARAKDNLLKAIALNPHLAEAYITLGLIETSREWKWWQAEQSLLKAIELAPNLPDAHHRYAMLLVKLRRFPEAETHIRRARELDPLSLSINMNLGVVLYYSKRFDEAFEQLKKTVELDAAFIAPHWYLARCYWAKGEKTAALSENVYALRANGDKELAEQIEQQMTALEPEKVIRNWEEKWIRQISPTGVDEHSMAVLASYRNDRESVLKWLEKSVDSRHPWATSINAEPEFDFVRHEPRFVKILEKMNLQ